MFLSSPSSSHFPSSPPRHVSLPPSSSCLSLLVTFPPSPSSSPHRLPFLPPLIAFPSRGSSFVLGFTVPGSCCSPHHSLCWCYAGITGLVLGIDLLVAFVFALCWSCFVRLHVLALGVVRGVGTQLLIYVQLGFLGLRMRCPFTDRVGWLVGCLVMCHCHHCRSSDGGGSPPLLSSLAFPTNDRQGYLVEWFPALRSSGLIFIGICRSSSSCVTCYVVSLVRRGRK